MTEIQVKKLSEKENDAVIRLNVTQGDRDMTGGTFRYCLSSYGRGYIPTLTVGGVGTAVESRRGGNVRAMFKKGFDIARDYGTAVSMLHPFSFAYYRKFGYEKTADHKIVTMPLRLLDFVPRRCSLVRFEKAEQAEDLIKIYDAFARGGRNLLIARQDDAYFKDREIFIYYMDGEPAGYVAYRTQKRLEINHMTDGVLTVEELAYTCPEALKELLSFLRMYEGELDTLVFANIAPCPEVEVLLRHYTHAHYRLLPDIMTRVLDAEKLLSAQAYPQKEGGFTLQVTDDWDITSGTYRVEYGGGEGRARRVADSVQADAVLSVQALARIAYGYDGLNADIARYMEGVELRGDCEELFRAFPARPCGVFEHF